MQNRLLISLLLLLLGLNNSYGQLFPGKESGFDRCDSLPGYLYPERAAMDVFFYELDLEVDPIDQSISGKNIIHFVCKEKTDVLQLDLYENMQIDSVLFQNRNLPFERECNAFFIKPVEELLVGEEYNITVYYHGKPIVAKNAPWDGGFTWSEDAEGNPWIGTSVQGMGASLFWPCKDHLSDEPDSMLVHVTVPKPLIFVGNGRLVDEREFPDDKRRFSWKVSYPINLYNISLNIANYVHFGDLYTSPETGEALDLDYYVLPENLSKAKLHFEQVKPMLACYEQYLGPFPFWEDGFKLVETPYLGMEHQTAIAYGNEYKTGYKGMDYSKIGLEFDYIIIHESGHEYWGNNVSCADVADLWIHEGFCTYSEAIYVECLFDYETALSYINAKKGSIGNKRPILGTYNVHHEGSGDMYSKGMLFLNTLRHIINNDELWWDMLKDMQTNTFKLQAISTEDVLTYMEARTGTDLEKIFEQYLAYPEIPALNYRIRKEGKKNSIVELSWDTDVEDFSMPVRLTTSPGKYEWVVVGPDTTELQWKSKQVFRFAVNEDLTYIKVRYQE
jgi:aminopeptidase N